MSLNNRGPSPLIEHQADRFDPFPFYLPASCVAENEDHKKEITAPSPSRRLNVSRIAGMFCRQR